MTAPAKKFFVFLVVIIGITLLLFVIQYRRARSITVTQSQAELISTNMFSIPLGDTDPLFGNPGARYTIVEFVDLHNAQSRALHNTFIHFVDQHPQDVRLFWKNLPQKALLYGDNYAVHQGAICAGTGTNFWQFVGTVVAQKDVIKQSQLDTIVRNTALDTPQWHTCLNASSTLQKLSADVQLATELSIKSAPAVFINNKRIDASANIDWNQMLASLIEKQP